MAFTAMNAIRRMEVIVLESLLRDENGQDIVEYTLLMAALTIACAALVIGVGQQTAGIWSIVNSRLAAANTNATAP